MEWDLLPALVAAGAMVAVGAGVIVRPTALRLVGVDSTSPLGSSEIRAVFGGMFVALGLACILTRQPFAFATVGGAWLGDLVVRVGAVVVDRVPAKDAAWVLATAAIMAAALLSGYWLA